MRIIGFNCNGLRSVLKKNALQDLIKDQNPDILCLQETRCPSDLKVDIGYEYHLINESKTKKGYSGVAIFTNQKPIKILDDFQHNEEGRLICFEYDKFYLVNAYVPNSKPDLSRLNYRIETWEKSIREYINKLQKKKPIIYTADFNVAPNPIDIYSVKGHEKSHGFTREERKAFADLLSECNLIDTYRFLHPTEEKYTWFSNIGKARQKNKGWRIDEFLVSDVLKKHITKAEILSDYLGSDHVPILLEIDL